MAVQQTKGVSTEKGFGRSALIEAPSCYKVDVVLDPGLLASGLRNEVVQSDDGQEFDLMCKALDAHTFRLSNMSDRVKPPMNYEGKMFQFKRC